MIHTNLANEEEQLARELNVATYTFEDLGFTDEESYPKEYDEDFYGQVYEEPYIKIPDTIIFGQWGIIADTYWDDILFGFMVGTPDGCQFIRGVWLGNDMEFYSLLQDALMGSHGAIVDVVNRCQDSVGVWTPTAYGYDYEGWELVMRL